MPISLVPDSRVNFLASLFGVDTTPQRTKPRTRTRAKPRVTTREEEIRKIARERVRRADRVRLNIPVISDLADSFSASVSDTFGIGPRIVALPRSLISGRSYTDELDIARAENEIDREKSPIGNILGALYGGAGSGGAAAGAIRATGRQVGGRVGQVLEGLTRLERGQRGRNAAKIVAGGAAGGAAQAAGEGKDVTTGAAVGAVAAPAFVAGGKLARRLAALPANYIGSSSAVKGILRRITNTPIAEIESRAAQRRADGGTEPTVFELLNPSDQKRILDDIISPSADVGEYAGRNVAARLQEIGPAAQARIGGITQPRIQQAEQEILGRLESARGGQLAEGDEAFAQQAIRSPFELDELAGVEAKAIMAPFDNQIAVASIDDLVPRVPINRKGRISEQPDPEVASLLGKVAGTSRLRGDSGITVGEITKLRRSLKALAGNKKDINSGPAQRAVDYIDETLARRIPEAAQAVAQMDEAFASASRIREGAEVGAKTRLRDAAGRQVTQKTRNAFDTPEGATGRAIGQTNRLLEMFAGKPGETARALQEIRGNSLVQRAISDNIGAQEGGDIVRAAQSLDDAVKSLSRALPRAEGAGQGGADDLDILVDAFTLGNPAAFPTAKAWAVRRLLNATKIPDRKARTIVDMLFSRDPTQTRRALNLLDTSLEDASSFRRDLGLALAIGQISNSANESGGEAVPVQEVPEEAVGAPRDYTQMSDEELLQLYEQQNSGDEQDYTQMSDEELLQLYEQQTAAPYGRSIIESVFPGAVVTDDIRDPNSRLGQANPNSFHTRTDAAVDVRPIPGLTFEQFINQLQAAGFEIVEARDEVTNPSGHATGPHWHVVFA